jgi:hypothetical protein
VSEKYERIDAEKANYPIIKMCAWLGVSNSGFHEWRTRDASPTTQRRDMLKALITEIFHSSEQTYGYRRVWAELDDRHVVCCPETTRTLMRELGLVACQPRPWRPITTIAGDAGDIPDLVARDFTANKPGTKLVGSGSRRESHPPAPTEPRVIVSHYTALAILFTRNCGTTASERTSPGVAV